MACRSGSSSWGRLAPRARCWRWPPSSRRRCPGATGVHQGWIDHPKRSAIFRGPRVTLRVTGGEVRGRRLLVPRGIRPTEGLVREAIFNMIAAAVPDAVVLDLFAGSGVL